MTRLEVNRLTNANVYMDGANLLGKAEEVTLPDLVPLMSEHKALGLAGKFELPTGGVDKMGAKIKWNAIYSEVLKLAADPFTARHFQIRGSIDQWVGGSRVMESPYVVFMTATFKKLPLGGFKPHENVELESELNVTYIKVMVDGETVCEFSTFGNVWKAGSEDLLAGHAANVGA